MASNPPHRPADFEGRLLAEAIRAREEAGAGPLGDPAADDAALRAEGGLEEKLVSRARAHRLADEAREAIGRFRLAMRLACGFGAGLAVLAGFATAQGVLSAPAGQAVPFHWALIGLLGVETLTLLIWIALSLWGGAALRAPSLGGLILAATRRLAGWLERGKSQGAVLQGLLAVQARGALARWTLGAITHGLWSAFLLGALAMTLLVLSARQVVFGWETTILSESVYLPVTQALAMLPKLVGFATPSAEQIAASRWDGAGDLPLAAAGAWSGLLVGCLLLYGLLPRATLFALSLALRARAARDFRLNLAEPTYVRLGETLMPRVQRAAARSAGHGDGAPSQVPPAPLPGAALDGPVALLGLELSATGDAWPPGLAGIGTRDLGLVDSRQERAQALDALGAAAPSLVLVAVSLLTTPDRGIATTLAQVQESSGAPMVLLLTEGAALAARGAEPARAQRHQDWHRLAAELGLPVNWMIEAELGDRGLAERLTALAGDTP
ncbi:MAG: DUF2868 domain-containing protein [Pseudomonadota bacterium]